MSDRSGGDSFYVRAHFAHNTSSGSSSNSELSFAINDILHVTDTLYNGVVGKWVATRLTGFETCDEDEMPRGAIPNKASAEQLVAHASTIEQRIAKSAASTAASSSISRDVLTNQQQQQQQQAAVTTTIGQHFQGARMSIRKRLAKATARSSSRSKSVPREPTASSSCSPSSSSRSHSACAVVVKPNTHLSSKFATYERVELSECKFARPVVLFGVLADVARDKLKTEAPAAFELPDSYSPPAAAPNQTPAAAAAAASGVIKLASIRAIIEKGRHCLLDITPNAVDHLNLAQYYPICVYLRVDSHSHAKDLRHKYATAKSAR